MQHDERTLNSLGEFESFEGVAFGQLAFARALGRELVEVRRGIVYAHRQGTEVMQAGNFYFTRGDSLQDPRQQAHSDAMTEFSVFEAELPDLLKHCPAIRMAMGIPAGREGVQ